MNPKPTNIDKSQCHNAPVVSVTSDEGTGYYICKECGEPCDIGNIDKVCPTCGNTNFPEWNDRGECIKCARDRVLGTGTVLPPKQQGCNICGAVGHMTSEHNLPDTHGHTTECYDRPSSECICTPDITEPPTCSSDVQSEKTVPDTLVLIPG